MITLLRAIIWCECVVVASKAQVAGWWLNACVLYVLGGVMLYRIFADNFNLFKED